MMGCAEFLGVIDRYRGWENQIYLKCRLWGGAALVPWLAACGCETRYNFSRVPRSDAFVAAVICGIVAGRGRRTSKLIGWNWLP